MSQSPRTHNLQLVTTDLSEGFTFEGLRFSRADPMGPDGYAYNRIGDRVEDGNYTWTPAQEVARSTDPALRTESKSVGLDEAREGLRRVVP
jgi:hypothetical protein